MFSQVTCPETALALQAYKYENNSPRSTQEDSLWYLQDFSRFIGQNLIHGDYYATHQRADGNTRCVPSNAPCCINTTHWIVSAILVPNVIKFIDCWQKLTTTGRSKIMDVNPPIIRAVVAHSPRHCLPTYPNLRISTLVLPSRMITPTWSNS